VKSKIKIAVIVDRDVIALDVTRQVLELYGGYKVCVAHELAVAEAALNLLGMVDVLVTDVHVAGCGSSSDLCRHAIEQHPSIGIILTSDSGEEKFPGAPARSQFLIKPFGIDALLAAISPKARTKSIPRKSPLGNPGRGSIGSMGRPVHPCLNRRLP
jgi:Response regulator containing CheY-like receiver, AAA-type ATPase, and DNA-binding domains